MDIKTVGLACDHAGFPLKKFVIQYLEDHGYQYKDYGTYSDMSCDYPDFAHPWLKELKAEKYIQELVSAEVVKVWLLH